MDKIQQWKPGLLSTPIDRSWVSDVLRAGLEIDTDQKGPVEQSTYVPVAHPALFYIRFYGTLYHQRTFMSPIKILYHQSTGATPKLKLKKVQNGQIKISGYTSTET